MYCSGSGGWNRANHQGRSERLRVEEIWSSFNRSFLCPDSSGLSSLVVVAVVGIMRRGRLSRRLGFATMQDNARTCWYRPASTPANPRNHAHPIREPSPNLLEHILGDKLARTARKSSANLRLLRLWVEFRLALYALPCVRRWSRICVDI